MTTAYIEHRVEEGIHIFTFHKVTRPALDEYVNTALPALKEHIDLYQDSVPFCYVLNLAETGMFPVKYVMDKVSAVLKTLAYHPQHYIAYLVTDPSDAMLVNIINTLTARNLQHTRKVFLPDQTDRALTWLSEIRNSFLASSGA